MCWSPPGANKSVFSKLLRPSLELTQPSVQGYCVLFLQSKTTREWIWALTFTSAKLKNKGSYITASSYAFMVCTRTTSLHLCLCSCISPSVALLVYQMLLLFLSWKLKSSFFGILFCRSIDFRNSPFLLVYHASCQTCSFPIQCNHFFHATYISWTILKIEAEAAPKR
jgi:hypothetical protein